MKGTLYRPAHTPYHTIYLTGEITDIGRAIVTDVSGVYRRPMILLNFNSELEKHDYIRKHPEYNIIDGHPKMLTQD